MSAPHFFHKVLWLSLLLTSLSACQEEEIGPTKACDNPLAGQSARHPKNALYQSIIDQYTRKGLPGIALLIRDKDGAWAGASGMADLEKGIPMEPCNVSKVASVTKLFIGTLTMQLVEEGKISLDDPVSKYISAQHVNRIANADKSTLRMLLNHTSGIFDVIESSQFYLAVVNNPQRHWKSEELLEFVYDQKPVFPAGKDLEYSNTNFILAQMMLEKAAGRPAPDMLREKIFQPLGLQNTYYFTHDKLPANTAQGYYDLYNNGTIVNMSNFNTASGNGYGGMFSTVFDMQKFIEALLRERTLLRPATLQEMVRISAYDEAELEAYGVAIRKDFLDRAPSEYGFGHRGRDLSYSADLFYFPNQDITMAYLVNYGTDADSGLKQVFLDFRKAIVDAFMEK